jgi:hypothetical protein
MMSTLNGSDEITVSRSMIELRSLLPEPPEPPYVYTPRGRTGNLRGAVLSCEIMRAMDPANLTMGEIFDQNSKLTAQAKQVSYQRQRVDRGKSSALDKLDQIQMQLQSMREGLVSFHEGIAACHQHDRELQKLKIDAAKQRQLSQVGLMRSMGLHRDDAEARLRAQRPVASKKLRSWLEALGVPVSVSTDDPAWMRRLANIFGSMDSNNSGSITVAELERALARNGLYYADPETEINEVLRPLQCPLVDGEIKFEPFKKAVRLACQPNKRLNSAAKKVLLGAKLSAAPAAAPRETRTEHREDTTGETQSTRRKERKMGEGKSAEKRGEEGKDIKAAALSGSQAAPPDLRAVHGSKAVPSKYTYLVRPGTAPGILGNLRTSASAQEFRPWARTPG